MCDPILISTAISAGANLLGQGAKQDAEKRARDEQLSAVNKQENEMRSVKDLYKPYVDAGSSALSTYQDYLSGKIPIEQSADYKYNENLLKQRLASTGESTAPTTNMAYYTPLLANESKARYDRLTPLINAGQFGTQGQAGASRDLASLYGNAGKINADYSANDYVDWGSIVDAGMSSYKNLSDIDYRKQYLDNLKKKPTEQTLLLPQASMYG